MGLLTALSVVVPAHADVSPAGCGGNQANFDVKRVPAGPTYRLGDPVTFVLTGDNTKAGGCDIIMTSPLNFNLPNNRGLPQGPATTLLSSGATFRFGDTLPTTSVPWTVAADPDVQFAQAALAGDADLQDVPAPQHDYFRIARSISLLITHPSMALTKVANPVQGLAPLPVTYTYALTNTGDADIGNINLSDAGAGACSPVMYQSGDLNKDSVLQAQVKNAAGVVTTPAETWLYTCQRVFPNAGVYPNVATATGTSKVDNRPVNPVQANASVTVTPQAGPPAAPPAAPPGKPIVAPAVKPAAVDTCIESPKSLSLRARELTTVRVTLNSKTKGVKVTVKGPGFTKTLTTNANGQATFRVRPTRSGTLTITSTNCAKVTKAAVKAARKTVTQRVPQVTG